MKRFMFTIALMGTLVVFWDPARNLFSKFLRLEAPTTHEIQKGDWLSKIARQYYGDVSYWRELALVNRAPDGDLIFPGEKIIVPNFETVQQIRRTRSLAKVNDLVREQQEILAGRVPAEDAKPLAVIEKAAPTEESSGGFGVEEAPTPNSQGDELATMPDSPEEEVTPSYPSTWEATEASEPSFWLSTPVLTALVILGVVALIGVFLYVQKKRRQDEVELYGASEASDSEDKSAYDFSDLDDADESDRSKTDKSKPVQLLN